MEMHIHALKHSMLMYQFSTNWHRVSTESNQNFKKLFKRNLQVDSKSNMELRRIQNNLKKPTKKQKQLQTSWFEDIKSSYSYQGRFYWHTDGYTDQGLENIFCKYLSSKYFRLSEPYKPICIFFFAFF